MAKNDALYKKVRKKLGITQSHLAALFNISRSKLALAESGRRNLHFSSIELITNMFLQFMELENGSRANYRSLETRLFLNHEYKKVLPEMATMEKECRSRIQMLKTALATMKEKARDAEHSIIVLSNLVDKLSSSEENKKKIEWVNLLKQQVYDNLLTCWEPEQSKLHIKIEALAGEARALRRYRVKVMREHGPFEKERKRKAIKK